MNQLQVFGMAEKVGIKKEMMQTLKDVMESHKDTKGPKKFGPEELFYVFQMGLADAKAPDNFTYTSWFTLAKAYLYGYLLGKAIVREMERK